MTVFNWFKANSQREKIRTDRKHLEQGARRLLKKYSSEDGPSKAAIYELVAGAAAGCQPDVSDLNWDGLQLAQASAETAIKVVRVREGRVNANNALAELITDAYATVAIAYRRASTAYTLDKEMQPLGTAAVHLLTIATSYMAAQLADTEQK
jgi:hypothetical protein